MHNLTTQLMYHARVTPGSEALIYDGTRLSWQALNERVQEIAGAPRASAPAAS